MYQGWSLLTVLILGTICGHSLAFWPFQLFTTANGLESSNTAIDGAPRRIAIIGAGAAGSSTAFHLERFAAISNVPIEITIFERSSYVGGRSTTVNAYNDSLLPVELGASIFVDVNTILKNATDLFGLKPKDSESEFTEVLGIWNGKEFVYTQRGNSWWNVAKLFWKYGLAPYRTQKLMTSTVGKFRKLYEQPFFPFRSLSDRALDLDLISVTSITGEQYLNANKIGAPFSTDIIQASTRVNYGQNLNVIHGLETMVCMAIDGAMQIEGGNWQIFAGMVNASDATIHLNTSVTGVKKSKGKYRVASTKETATSIQTTDDPFDTVVLAAPLQYSQIEIEKGTLRHTPDAIPYVTLHVTLFTSTKTLNPVYFNLAQDAEAPTTILTTLSPNETTLDPENGVGSPGFFSISTLRTIVNPRTLEKEYLYKIFSPQKVTAEFLSDILGTQIPEDLTSFTSESRDSISWYFPHAWNSYPYEYPRVTFEELELARGFYYTSGIESFISTMETSALMGMNVAQLIVDDYLEVLSEERKGDIHRQKVSTSDGESGSHGVEL